MTLPAKRDPTQLPLGLDGAGLQRTRGDSDRDGNHAPTAVQSGTERPVPLLAAGPALVDIPTVAESLGVTVRHVRRLVAERRIPHVRVGHFIRFDPDDVRRWIDDHRVTA